MDGELTPCNATIWQLVYIFFRWCRLRVWGMMYRSDVISGKHSGRCQGNPSEAQLLGQIAADLGAKVRWFSKDSYVVMSGLGAFSCCAGRKDITTSMNFVRRLDWWWGIWKLLFGHQQHAKLLWMLRSHLFLATNFGDDCVTVFSKKTKMTLFQHDKCSIRMHSSPHHQPVQCHLWIVKESSSLWG